MLEKKNLRAGMKVCNKTSAAVGEIRGKGRKLLSAHPEYLAVRAVYKSGKNVGRYRYKWWWLPHLILISR